METDAINVCINCWSGPRCVSTSLMRAFAQRKDTQVLDEPLYAHYLKMYPDADRPYRDLVIAAQDSNGNAVVRDKILADQETRIRYVKHMAKQRQGIGRDLLLRGKHVLLVRTPEFVIRSFREVLEPTLHDTCYTSLLEIYGELRSLGNPPVVILSEDLVDHPEPTLRALCDALAIPFDPAMLSWAPGPRPEDGPWAPWWYAGTYASTGFSSEKKKQPKQDPSSFPAQLRPLLLECRPLYDMLRQRALRPRVFQQSSSTLTLQQTSGREYNQSEQDRLRAIMNPSSCGGPPPPPPPAAGPTAWIPSSDKAMLIKGTHAYVDDPRNADVLVGMRNGVNGTFDLVPRPFAQVSVLDSGFMLGDGVWEGIRQSRGVLLFAEAHLSRLYEGAKALDMHIDLSPAELQSLIYKTLDANGMSDGVHVRLMVTRGLKSTPYQHPKCTLGSPTIVILPEYKSPDQGPALCGIKLFTVHVRRGAPDVQDPSLNSHSKLNCIAACIQAAKAGADEALMLDPRGFVATCNSTNFFIVRDNEVWTAGPQYQLHGITRAKVLQVCASHGIPALEKDFSLTQVYSADEAFVTGTFAGVLPVIEIDGRCIGKGQRGPMVDRLQGLYRKLCDDAAGQGRSPIEEAQRVQR